MTPNPSILNVLNSSKRSLAESRVPGQTLSQDLQWFEKASGESLKRLMEGSVPTARDPSWKYTRLQSLLKEASEGFAEQGDAGDVQDGHGVQEDVIERILAQYPSPHRAVFLKGQLSERFSSLKHLPSGVQLELTERSKKTTSFDALLQRDQKDVSRWTRDLVFGYASSGLALTLDEGVRVDAPLVVVHFDDSMQALRHRFCLGAQSHLEIVDVHVGTGSFKGLSASSSEFVLGRGALLKRVEVLDHGPGHLHLGTALFDLQSGSSLQNMGASRGGALQRSEVTAHLQEKAEAHFYQVSCGQGQGTQDHVVRVVHEGKDSQSSQLMKGMLGDSSRFVFDGQIQVGKDASGTQARQLSQSLLLSRDARSYVMPQLYIDTDEVKCTHGSTTGQIQPEQLFYLMSRGIPEALAKKMLLRAFVEDVLQFVPVTSLKKVLSEIVFGGAT